MFTAWNGNTLVWRNGFNKTLYSKTTRLKCQHERELRPVRWTNREPDFGKKSTAKDCFHDPLLIVPLYLGTST